MEKLPTIEELKTVISSHLNTHLQTLLPRHPIKEAYLYAVLPPGKLFRPLLVAAFGVDNKKDFFQDFQNPWNDHALFSSFVELHHAYTLVHDDLPSLDNDTIRRNRPSLHHKFGEWKALLVGDGLHAASYRLLAQIKGMPFQNVHRLATWALGPKGLIQGQVLDLMGNQKESFDLSKRIHTLKTARLIQTCLVGSALLFNSPVFILKKVWRQSLNLGLLFQFLDDLTELSSPLSKNEEKINPWVHHPNRVAQEVHRRIAQNRIFISDQPMLNQITNNYYHKIVSSCQNGRKHLDNYLSCKMIDRLFSDLQLDRY